MEVSTFFVILWLQTSLFQKYKKFLIINELEYIQGEIYANIWQTERIARIDPLTGQVVGWIDLKGILSPEDDSEIVDVLNGITYDAKNNRLFVT